MNTEDQKPDPIVLSILQTVAAHATKGEIAAWNRKRKSIERLIGTHIQPIEDKILELNAQLIPLYDQLQAQRTEMVEFCVHPIDMLIYKDDHVECKFCMARLGVPNVKRETK